MYKLIFVGMHFVGAITELNTIWSLGDTALSLVTIPNVFALILLSGVVKELTRDYFGDFKPGITKEEYLQRARERRDRSRPA